jgi:CheY-like chemotaxis protein
MSAPAPAPDPTSPEQRRHARLRVLRRAVLVDGDTGDGVSCLILDISSTGAKVQILGGTLPDRGLTLVDGRTGALHHATTVWRHGPFAGVAFTSTVELDAAPPESQSGGGPRLRVLAVDDDEINRFVLEKALNSLEADITFAVCGEDAVSAFEREAFDIVLMDLSMPRMDGFEAIRLIRAIETADGRRRTPILVVSAHTEPPEIARAAEAGADDHIAKPVSWSILLYRIRVHTQRAAASA